MTRSQGQQKKEVRHPPRSGQIRALSRPVPVLCDRGTRGRGRPPASLRAPRRAPGPRRTWYRLQDVRRCGASRPLQCGWSETRCALGERISRRIRRQSYAPNEPASPRSPPRAVHLPGLPTRSRQVTRHSLSTRARYDPSGRQLKRRPLTDILLPLFVAKRSESVRLFFAPC
jgi:hypothetical protein